MGKKCYLHLLEECCVLLGEYLLLHHIEIIYDIALFMSVIIISIASITYPYLHQKACS